jgi:hypothetical protein
MTGDHVFMLVLGGFGAATKKNCVGNNYVSLV